MFIEIFLTVSLGLAATVAIVSIYNLFDTSPVKDERCRGGHDF